MRRFPFFFLHFIFHMDAFMCIPRICWHSSESFFVGPAATLPSSDDFDRNGRAQLHAGGVSYIPRDVKRLPSELSALIYEHLSRGAHTSSSSGLAETKHESRVEASSYLPRSFVEASFCARLKSNRMFQSRYF